MSSLDPAEQKLVDRAWLAESRDRLNAFRNGELKALDGDTVLQVIAAELHGGHVHAGIQI